VRGITLFWPHPEPDAQRDISTEMVVPSAESTESVDQEHAATAAAAPSVAAPPVAKVVAPEDVAAAANHVISLHTLSAGPRTSVEVAVNLSPAQRELANQIHAAVSASDHAIDVLVQVQQRPVTPAQVKEAKVLNHQLNASEFAHLRKEAESKVDDKLIDKAIDKGVDSVLAALAIPWDLLELRIKKLKAKTAHAGERSGAGGSPPVPQSVTDDPSSSNNPILERELKGLEGLAHMFGPRDAEPKTLPASYIVENLRCSPQEAEAYLHLGPFAEVNGAWQLDRHLANPELLIDSLNILWDFPTEDQKNPG
jgi:hypothetical protein